MLLKEKIPAQLSPLKEVEGYCQCWNHYCPAIHPGIVFEKAIAWLLCFKRYLVGLLGKDLDSIPRGPLTVTEVVAAESHYQSCPARHT